MRPIITIDGPAGVGKSSVATLLAAKLGIPCLDTGAMFRALALKLGPGHLDASDACLTELCSHLRFTLTGTGENSILSCDGRPLGGEIREEAVSSLASRYALKAPVRKALLMEERQLGNVGPLVADGRDLGSVVFPDAKFKFFLEAEPEIRARRRLLQLQEKGESADLAQLSQKIRERDEQDRNRPIAPLRPSQDARVIDSSHLTIGQVLTLMLDYIQANGGISSKSA